MRNRPPNILLITADQLRYDCVGYSGKCTVRTPNLDRLASQGMAFSHAYSVLPVCCPARQSLLHGARPETFGALWNYSGALPVAALPPDAYTWPRTLAENGYASSYLGKWGVNPVYDATAYGYQSCIGENEYREYARTAYPDVRYKNGYFGEPNSIPLADSGTHWFAGRAVRELERLQSRGEPWHLALHFSDPHLPCRPSAPFDSMYDPADIREWEGYGDSLTGKPYIQRQQRLSWGVEHYTWDDWAPIVARYYGQISQLDDAVGKVLNALDKSGAAEDTIVIFTADHGDMCGSHGMMDKHYILYDDVVRVPLIIRWSGIRNAGRICGEFVYNFLDLPPTLLGMPGVEAYSPSHLQGRSLMPLLAGQPLDEPWRDAVVSTYNGQQFGLYTQRMIRTKHWKYIWNCTDIDELYHLQADPGELDNVINDADYAPILTELRIRLFDQLKADGDAIVDNEWTKRQLLSGAKLSVRDRA